ncbi:MAG: CoA transferase [Planctomycetes bacterium]|nr:CoA transferase [Planctomycetota bacterium]
MTALLEGLTVLDLTQLLPGPFATQLLVEMGARVIKIEPPGVGDPTRVHPPHGPDGQGVLFAAVNRGKESVVLDLKARGAASAFLDLARTADVTVEGFRPGVAARLGIGPDQVRRANPRIVYVSITGYGQTGPNALRAGHDSNYQALAGTLFATGAPGGPPVLGAVQVADLAGGALSAVVALLGALYRREKSGEGATLDISMHDGTCALNVLSWSIWRGGGPPPGPAETVLTGLFPCYRLYRTADNRWLSVGALEPKFWLAFTEGLGAPDLGPEGFSLDPEVGRRVADLVASRDLAHWQEVFATRDACAEPVLDVAEAAGHPHAVARGLDSPSAPPFPFLVDGLRPASTRPAPALGADTERVLAEAGLSPERIAKLRG